MEDVPHNSSSTTLCPSKINSVEILWISGFANSITILINLSFILVLSRRRQTLNFENLHAVNLLLSTMVLSSVALFDFAMIADFDSTHLETSYADFHMLHLQLLGFIRALRLSLILTIGLSLLTLVYGQRRHFRVDEKIGKLVSKQYSFRQRPANTKMAMKKFYKREKFKAILAVVLCWLLPLCLAIPVPAGWNCISKHPCFSGYFSLAHDLYTSLSDDFEFVCSFFWPPLTTNFVITITTCWIVNNIITFSTLIFLVKSHFDNTETKQNTAWKFKSLKSSIRGIIIICVSTFLTNSPFVLILFYNAVAQLEIYETAVQVAVLFSYIHMPFIPFILLGYLPGVRSSMLNALTKCSCMWKTTLARKTDEQSQIHSPDMEDIPLTEYWHLMTLGSTHVGPSPSTPEEERLNKEFLQQLSMEPK
ncbi:uncharacterized protein LOC120341608 isoform X1 [Styela clava]